MLPADMPPDAGAIDSGTFDAAPPVGDAGPPTTCWNGVLDGDETQTDCGGSCPTNCSGLYDCAGQTDIPPSECWALVALYESTDGSGWTNSDNWLATAPCQWNGITCDVGHVTRIGLWRNLLRGQIPAAIGNLTRLTHLEISTNSLNGSMPPGIGDLTNLVRLSLLNNQLSGSIPTELGNLSNLQGLELQGNLLTGQIPRQLGNLSNLTTIYLYDNQLSGSIPGTLGRLTRLTVFNIRNNQLSGSIPAELGDLTSVEWFELQDNRVSGEVPRALMSIPGTSRFWLHGNGCLTASDPELISWLDNKDPSWGDGC